MALSVPPESRQILHCVRDDSLKVCRFEGLNCGEYPAPDRKPGRLYTAVMFRASSLSGTKQEQYAELAQQAQALLDGESDRIANAANLSALVYHALPGLNWVGFYFFDGHELVVGPFQGLPACIRIPLDKGVCGAAARSGRTQRVDDVDAFPGHVACDSASRSELVVPLLLHGDGGGSGGEDAVHDATLIGVFDLDSPESARFDVEDQRGIERIARIYVQSLRQASQ